MVPVLPKDGVGVRAVEVTKALHRGVTESHEGKAVVQHEGVGVLVREEALDGLLSHHLPLHAVTNFVNHLHELLDSVHINTNIV